MIHCGGGDSWDESIEMGMWSIADFLPLVQAENNSCLIHISLKWKGQILPNVFIPNLK